MIIITNLKIRKIIIRKLNKNTLFQILIDNNYKSKIKFLLIDNQKIKELNNIWLKKQIKYYKMI